MDREKKSIIYKLKVQISKLLKLLNKSIVTVLNVYFCKLYNFYKWYNFV